MSLVRVDELGKEYRARLGLRDWLRGRLHPVVALKDVTFTLDSGEILVVLGVNGAGKSTLLKCLGGLVVPTSGEAWVCGHDCGRPSLELRRDAVYVAADPRSFAWRLSGRANLEFFAALYGYKRGEAQDRAQLVLDRVGIDREAGERWVATYSTGMRQRLALARGFLGEPKVLLLDEPTAGLDPFASRELRVLIRDLATAGRTIIMATHFLDEARELGTRALVLDAGKMTHLGPFPGQAELFA